MDLDLRQSLDYVGPELTLATAAVVVAALARLQSLDRRGLGEIALLGAALSVLMSARLSGWGEVWIFERSFVVDGLAIFCKIVVGLATVGVLWIWLESTAGSREGGVGALLLLAALALDLVASAAHLVSAFLAIELAGLSLWGLCRTPKAGVHRSAASAWMVSFAGLGALGWIRGYTGDGDYERIRAAIFGLGADLPLAAVLCAVMVPLALPAHAFAATSVRAAHVRLPLAAFLSVAFTAGGVGLCVRWVVAAWSRPGVAGRWASPPGADWSLWLGTAAVAVLLLGSLAALRERTLSRLLAAGSIAQLGFALLGVATMSDVGLRATLSQIAVSSLATLGAFHCASLVLRGTDRDAIEACGGLLGRAWSFAGVTFAIFLLSLSGLPPLAGFMARLDLVRALLSTGHSGFAAVAIAGTVAMIIAYGRVLRALHTPAIREMPALRFYDLLLSGLLAAATVGFGVYRAPLADVVARSVHFLPR